MWWWWRHSIRIGILLLLERVKSELGRLIIVGCVSRGKTRIFSMILGWGSLSLNFLIVCQLHKVYYKGALCY